MIGRPMTSVPRTVKVNTLEFLEPVAARFSHGMVTALTRNHHAGLQSSRRARRCLVAVPLSAQTASNSRGAFVDLPVGPDWDDAYSESTRVRGATLESGFAFGFDSRRSGVEFDVGVPRWHVKNHAPHRFQYVGRSSGYEQQGHFYESSSTVRRRSIDVILRGFLHVRYGRLSATHSALRGSLLPTARTMYCFPPNI